MQETISLFLEPLGHEHRCLQGIKMGPRDYDKVAHREELRVILPGFYFTEGIGPDDKKEPLPFSQVAMIVGDGLDGIRCPLPFYLHIREGEGWIIGNSQFDHIPAVLSGDDGAIQFMGGGGGQDEDYLTEIEGLPYLLGTAQMPQVDGIESPPEKPDSPLSFVRRS
jgi:hypothetical protein